VSADDDRSGSSDELPDPKLFWQWVGSATRPVIGWILVALGALAIIVGYVGVARQVLVAKQLPYLISGGILGVAIVAVGVMFIGTEQIRRDSGRLDRLEAMVAELHAVLLTRADAPTVVQDGHGPGPHADEAGQVDGGPLLVALPEGERYHAETCRVVQGKAAAMPVGLRTIQRLGLTPCPLCEPMTVGG